MRSRERMTKALAHEVPDRTPAVIAAQPEVERALTAYYGVDSLADALDILGIVQPASVGLDVSFPDFEQKETVHSHGDWMGAGGKYLFHDERTIEDEWGVLSRIGKGQKFVQWVTGPLTEAKDPDEYDYPTVDRIIDDPTLADRVSTYKEDGLFVMASVLQPFKRAWLLRGMENLLADYLVNPGFVEALYDRILVLDGEILRRCTKAGVDMIGIGGDIAMQDRVLMGPRCWREIDKPRLAAVIASCKAINPKVHVFLHSDGDISTIMPDLIEVGFDVIDPIQPECMDPVEVKKLYGDRITLHGCGSLQQTLPFGTV